MFKMMVDDDGPDMFAMVDAKTAKVTQCNETLATALGFSKKKIMGKSIFKLCSPEDVDDMKKNVFKKFIETGRVRNAELKLVRKDGSRIDVSLSMSAVRDKKENITHSMLILRDITERKRGEEELKNA